MGEHGPVIEAGFDLFRSEVFPHVFVFAEIFIEILALEPALHGVALHPAVRRVAVRALRDERQEHPRAVDEAAGHIQVGKHLFRIDEELVDELRRLVQDVVESGGRVGEDHALHGGVGNVSLVPERDVFKSRYGVALDETGHAADAFASHGISLVGHRGGAFLFRAEIFFRFPHFRPLEVAHFEGDLGQGGGNDGERRHVFRVMVALHHLRRDVFAAEAHLFAHVFFHIGIDIRIGADRAGELADAHVFSGVLHAVNVAERLRVPQEKLQAEGGRLGVHAVGAADGGGVLEFHSPPLQHVRQLLQVVQNDVRRLRQLHAEARVLHVRGGEPHVDVLRFVPYVFAHAGQEGDDVVIDLRVDLMDAVHIEIGLRLDDFHRFLRDAAQLGIRFARGDLHIEHGLPFISFIPDLFHHRTRISRYHTISPFGFPSRAQISRPTMTPAAEACASPLVIPAPSPMAKRLGIFVSSSGESSMREE